MIIVVVMEIQVCILFSVGSFCLTNHPPYEFGGDLGIGFIHLVALCFFFYSVFDYCLPSSISYNKL